MMQGQATHSWCLAGRQAGRQAVHFSPMQPSEGVTVQANSTAINTTSKTQQHHTARLIKRFTEIIN